MQYVNLPEVINSCQFQTIFYISKDLRIEIKSLQNIHKIQSFTNMSVNKIQI